MPLQVFARSAGHIVRDGDDARAPLRTRALPVAGEMPFEDLRGQGEGSWYFTTFSSKPYPYESKDYDDLKQDLSEYFGKHRYGPFYILESVDGVHATLDFVFLDQSDMTRFGNKWGDTFTHKPTGAARNAEIDRIRAQKGYTPKDPRLVQRYSVSTL